ncbi:uncharacterized protein LOC117654311 [Thrips palmi]|uniref:Uncharacterized protein LOC117654311 n=1 Tax=Thrips palmi TaxID=161013 RepID=A0A6P9AMI8_THRPL|nr:uncharacterized protein LOC117654311 [Thrips palmi]
MSVRPSHFNPSRPFDRQTLTGYFKPKVNVTNNNWARVDLAVRSNNQWKDNAFVLNFRNSACSTMREHVPDFFRIVAKHSGATTDTKAPCVIPAGHFAFKNESVAWTFPSFPVMPYGRYKFRATGGFSKSTAHPSFCVAVDCEVIPKPS